jgi:hypothetical protein
MKRLALPFGARAIRSGGDVTGADGGQRRLEEAAVGIGEGVVGHDPADGDAVGGEPGGGAREETGTSLASLRRQQFGVGEPRAVIDGNVEMLPAQTRLRLLVLSPVMRCPIPSILPSFLVSMWISPPGVARSQRTISGRSSSAFRRPRPSRRNTAPTVATGRARRRAMRGPLRRERAGVEGRSCRAISPPCRYRDSHLWAVRSETPPAEAACATGQPCWQTRSTIRIRPRTVIRAFLWTFIRGSRIRLFGFATTALLPSPG